MHCQEVRHLLSEYMDGQLEEAQQQTIAAHLKECNECGAELSELQQVLGLVRQLPELSPPPEFRTRLREQISSGGDFDSGQTKASRTAFVNRWIRFAAVAAVICLTLGMAAVMHGFPMPWGQKEVAQNMSQADIAVEEQPLGDLKQESGSDGRSMEKESQAGGPEPLMAEDNGKQAENNISQKSSSPETTQNAPGSGGQPASDDQQVSIMALPPEENGQGETAPPPEEDQEMRMTTLDTGNGEEAPDEQLININEIITLRVKNINETKKEVLNITANFSGELISEEEHALEISFPVEQYDSAVIQIKSAGEVLEIEEYDQQLESLNEALNVKNIKIQLQL